jgi:hypothetical protein
MAYRASSRRGASVRVPKPVAPSDPLHDGARSEGSFTGRPLRPVRSDSAARWLSNVQRTAGNRATVRLHEAWNAAPPGDPHHSLAITRDAGVRDLVLTHLDPRVAETALPTVERSPPAERSDRGRPPR